MIYLLQFEHTRSFTSVCLCTYSVGICNDNMELGIVVTQKQLSCYNTLCQMESIDRLKALYYCTNYTQQGETVKFNR